MSTIRDVEQIVLDNPDICDAGRPATQDLIDKAQAFLNLTFPQDFCEFVKKWGTLAIGPIEIYGITGPEFDSSCVPNAIWFTASKRQQLALPKELIILFDNNGAEYYCIDTTERSNSPVVIWDTRMRSIRAKKAESLFDFIVNEAADLL